jgi:soluble lytic murein transglycosylase-like protein
VVRIPRRLKVASKRIGLVAGALVAAFVMAVNGGVWIVSGSGPFPLDPRHLRGKVRALAAYARHRPGCLIFKDDDVIATARKAARKHGLDPDLFEALVQVESGSIAHRISRTGACGPAQLMLGTASDLGVKDPFDPATSLDGGARYLKDHLRRYKGRKDLALAAYNAGPGSVRNVVPANGETERYVPRVLALYEQKRAERLAKQVARAQR